MIRDYPNELWKRIIFDERFADDEEFIVSNYGRVIKKKGDSQDLVKVSLLNGYQVILVKKIDKGSKRFSLYLHKLMGQTFLEKREDQKFVIHLNYDKLGNRLENLKWATKREKELHQFSNPNWESIVKKRSRNIGKLSEGKVRIIKRQLKNKRTRITMIAKRFGVSDMQIHRIKSGENWSHVKI